MQLACEDSLSNVVYHIRSNDSSNGYKFMVSQSYNTAHQILEFRPKIDGTLSSAMNLKFIQKGTNSNGKYYQIKYGYNEFYLTYFNESSISFSNQLYSTNMRYFYIDVASYNGNKIIYIRPYSNSTKYITSDGTYKLMLGTRKTYINSWNIYNDVNSTRGADYDWSYLFRNTSSNTTNATRMTEITNDFAMGEHGGIDIIARTGITQGVAVYSPASGVVVDVGYRKSDMGNFVVIRLNSGLYIRFLHLKDYTPLHNNQVVYYNTLVGYVGNTGDVSTGPHLHFDVNTGRLTRDVNNNSKYPVNPKNFFPTVSFLLPKE